MQENPKKAKKVKILIDSFWLFMGKNHVSDDIHKVIELERDGGVITMSALGSWRGTEEAFKKDFTAMI